MFKESKKMVHGLRFLMWLYLSYMIAKHSTFKRKRCYKSFNVRSCFLPYWNGSTWNLLWRPHIYLEGFRLSNLRVCYQNQAYFGPANHFSLKVFFFTVLWALWTNRVDVLHHHTAAPQYDWHLNSTAPWTHIVCSKFRSFHQHDTKGTRIHRSMK